MAHVNDYKKKVVKEISELINQYNIIGIVNMENLPTKQLQGMRSNLRKDVVIRMSKKKLMKIALKNSDKKEVLQLTEKFRGMPAMIFTNQNPFTLFKTLEKNKSPAPAKAGQIATKDIVVPAGPTPFAPGPIIGELGALGIKTGVENGKVAVKEDSVVVKEGEKISTGAAAVLTRLDINPMEIGLDLVAVWEDGSIFDKKVLAIDEDEYIANVTQSHRWAFNLAVECGILTNETTEFLVVKAAKEAKKLAVSENILTSETTSDVLAKIERQMLSLKSITED